MIYELSEKFIRLILKFDITGTGNQRLCQTELQIAISHGDIKNTNIEQGSFAFSVFITVGMTKKFLVTGKYSVN